MSDTAIARVLYAFAASLLTVVLLAFATGYYPYSQTLLLVTIGFGVLTGVLAGLGYIVLCYRSYERRHSDHQPPA